MIRILITLLVLTCACIAQSVDTAPRSPVILATDPDCTRVGTFYVKSDGTFRRCTATGTPGTWADLGSTSLPSMTGKSGYVLTNDGSSPSWLNLTTGASGALQFTATPGELDIVTAVVPTKGASNVFTGANQFSSILAIPHSNTLPTGTCAYNGQIYKKDDAATGAKFYVNKGADGAACNWEVQGGGGGGADYGSVGVWHNFGNIPGVSQGSVAVTAQTTHFTTQIVTVSAKQTWNKASMAYVTCASCTGAWAQVALYDATCSTKLFESEKFATDNGTTTIIVSGSISPDYVVNPGIYQLAFYFSGAPNMQAYSVTSVVGSLMAAGVPTGTYAWGDAQGYDNTGFHFPNSCTSWASTSGVKVPVIYLSK